VSMTEADHTEVSATTLRADGWPFLFHRRGGRDVL
jgi:hypothetical protein